MAITEKLRELMKQAEAHGYSLYASAGCGTTVDMNKEITLPGKIFGQERVEFLTLSLTENGDAELIWIWKLLQIKTGKFSFPHKNFINVFENQIVHAMTRIGG